MIKIDLEIGDEILTGKFQNKRVIVKNFGTNDKNQPTVNGKPILKFRIAKLINKSEQVDVNHKIGENKKMKKSELKKIVKEVLNERNPFDNTKSDKVISKQLKEQITVVMRALSEMSQLYKNAGHSDLSKKTFKIVQQVSKDYKNWEQNAKGFNDKL